MEITLRNLIAHQPRRHPHRRLGELITIWYQRQQQRRVLLQLNDRMLSDIGISRCEAEQEAAKPFWRE
ncbi:DUF1127 domain-containing protein [Sedimenticola selenatireducens]|uniref:DUF1127 domain-containing protein n=1 Tax=Sedimenticola selenatireducens TaxID=191960 RepID=A0A2N6CYS2_9GAMM|nr:DUF1127 domain-containing protein [Sedimenticola selenatireducens]PLX62503.1 MAG: DUF1127 domain-containing protein [Sedimenticola selenatireducens]